LELLRAGTEAARGRPSAVILIPLQRLGQGGRLTQSVMTSHAAHSLPGHSLSELVRRQLAAENSSLPLFPETAARILAAVEDPDQDIRGLARMIELDPSLAANLMRVSNSVAYAPVEPIVTLEQAVSRLGMQTISGIATALALRSEVFSVPGYEPLLRKLWVHSAQAGAWAKEVARTRRKSVERAFLCGLLHDIGKPVVLQAAIALVAELKLEVHEKDLINVMDELHTEIAGRLLKEWSMPKWVQDSALYHHETSNSGEYREEVLTTSLANALAHSTEMGRLEEDEILQHPALLELGLYSDELDPLFSKFRIVQKLTEAIS
jgi:HD-like signal output (HDOD) protein